MYGYQSLRALVLGSALAFGNAMAPILRSAEGPTPIQIGGGKGRGSKTKSRSFWYRRVHTTSRQTRNPEDPVQAARIAAAMVKRERRRRKLNTDTSYYSNPAHRFNERLNPFYINRSTTV